MANPLINSGDAVLVVYSRTLRHWLNSRRREEEMKF